jgi:outer membrane protein TolC
VTTTYNTLESGRDTNENEVQWATGIGVEIPLFAGFRNRNQVREARARLEAMRERRWLLRDALALQVQAIFLRMNGALQQGRHAGDAARTAAEECELTLRAYGHELAETDDVLRSQISEALVKAQALRSRHEYLVGRAQLEFVVGRQWEDVSARPTAGERREDDAVTIANR